MTRIALSFALTVSLMMGALLLTNAGARDYYLHSSGAFGVYNGPSQTDGLSAISGGAIGMANVPATLYPDPANPGFFVWGLETPNFVRMEFKGDLNFDAGDNVYLVGPKPIEIVVNGDVTIPEGVKFIALNGGGQGGIPSHPPSGGSGGAGGAGGQGGAVVPLASLFGNPGTAGSDGADASAGGTGSANSGTDGFGAAGSGGFTFVTSSGGVPADNPPNQGGDGGPTVFILSEEFPGDGQPGKSAGLDGGAGSDGARGAGGKYDNPNEMLIGGGGGSSGVNGGSGAGGHGGAGGGGGGSSGHVTVPGGDGGSGGKGGSGGSGGRAGAGGHGGGAFRLRASTLTLGGELIARGKDGEGGEPTQAGATGDLGEAGADGFTDGGDGTKGGDGGDGGAGGAGAGGAGGTIILRVGWIDYAGGSTSNRIFVSGGATGDGDPLGKGEDGAFFISYLDDFPNTAAEADPITLTGTTTTLEGVIAGANDEDWITFTLSETALFRISTTSGLDTVGTLYRTGEASPLQEDDDSGDGNNFSLLRRLEAGSYTLRTTGYSSAQQGPYTLNLEEVPPIIVTTEADELDDPAGAEISLREAIRDSEAIGNIRFDSSLSGKTITLSQGQLVIDKDLSIDASDLPGGVTIHANGSVTGHRVLRIAPNNNASLHGLTFVGGVAKGSGAEGLGGAIYNDDATVSLSACTLSGNSADYGGGIFSNGRGSGHSATLSLSACTLSGNVATYRGGAIQNDGKDGVASLSMSDSTLSGNAAAEGGAIYNRGNSSGFAFLTLGACTLASNTASTAGGGILNDASGDEGISGFAQVTLVTTILANNTAPSGPDLSENSGAVTIATGNNLMSSLSGQTSLTAATFGLIVEPDSTLAPLGHYGGPTMTRHPLVGSPAILTGEAETTRTDQRGFTLTGPPTIGAVKVGPVTKVGNKAELIAALSASADTQGAFICFDPSLDGGTITLTGSQLVFPGTATGLTIYASDLRGGLTIDANQQSRIMEIQPNATAALHGLTLTGGQTSNGGGIFCDGSGVGTQTRLSLTACTLFGNSATNLGGGIYSYGHSGGSTTLNLTACTLFGNSSANFGGGIVSRADTDSTASLDLSACTVTGNAAANEGGGIYSLGINNGLAIVRIKNTILSANSAPTGPDLREIGTSTTLLGTNLIGEPNPLLAPLGHYGGPTMTMHPLAGSPANLAGQPDTTRIDQRGFTLTGPPTIGSVKLGDTTIVVNTAVDEDSPLTGDVSLRDALNLVPGFVPGGAVIRFDPSLNGSTITLTEGQLEVPGTANGLFVDASNLGDGLTIDANGEVTNHRVMEVQKNATVALHGLTLTGGRAKGSFPDNKGGAIYSDGEAGTQTRLSLSACTLSGNSALFAGGGIYSTGFEGSATLSLSACTLSGNSAEFGGGIFSNGSEGSATLSLSACTLSGNSAGGYGGGIFSDGSYGGTATLSLRACTLSGNSAFRGGGIFSNGHSGSATLSLSACTLSGNSAEFGGGIYSFGTGSGSATLSLSACTLSGNSAGSKGGGIYSTGDFGSATLSLSACTLSGNSAEFGGGIFIYGSDEGSATLSLNASTLSGNSAGSRGGGIYSTVDFGGSATLSLSNTILAANTAPTGPDLSELGDGASTTATGENLLSSLDGQTSLTEGPHVILAADPKLAPLGHYGGPTMTMPPLPGSPAIDAATSSTHTHDQRGFPITDGNPDIGAVEVQGTTDTGNILAAVWSTDSDNDGNPFGMEFALGTNSSVSDADNAANPDITTDANGLSVITFGHDPAANPFTEWVLTRSTDLINYNVELYRYDGTMETFSNGAMGDGLMNGVFTIIDTEAAGEDRYFYRFEAVAP